MKESLNQKNINSIQIFINLIFKKLSKLIKEYKCCKIDDDRLKFEKQVEDLIEECIKEYPIYYSKYIEENIKQLEFDIDSLKIFVTELIPPTKEIYPEIDYPMFNYFILTKYKTEEDLAKRMNNKKKYPLLNQLLSGNIGVKKLENLPAFNEFTNYMVENYSFKISREESKTKKLSSMDIVNQPEFRNKFKNFLKAWDEIKTEAIKYRYQPEMDVKDLTIDDNLIYFLNDNQELYNGMYLASACKKFIEYQNAFLQPILDENRLNGILHPYVDNIKKRIPVQEAKHDQIVLINERFSKTKYKDIFDVIYSFSGRNIFNEKGVINYSNYNSFEYDYDSIEEELGKIILPGVCLFRGEYELNFIRFWGEGLRGRYCDIFSEFYLKYPQKDLIDKEKEIIVEYINMMNIENIEIKKEKYDFKEFFGSFQLLIFYLTQKVFVKEEEEISNIIINSPEHLKLSEDCISFFNNEGKKITVNKIMNVFFFFEHLCFETLVDTLQLEYKSELPEALKISITNKLLKIKDSQDKITIKDLGAATRRLISRYLVGKTQMSGLREGTDFCSNLIRVDLWEEKIANSEDFEDNIFNKLYEFQLKVEQAYSFYNLIGEEDRNSIVLAEKRVEKKEQKIINSQMRMLKNHKNYDQSLNGKYIEEKDKNNDKKDKLKNLPSNKTDILAVNERQNSLKDIYQVQDKEVQDLNETIKKLDLDLEKEKEINYELNLKIQKLENLLKDKENEIAEVKRVKEINYELDLKIKKLENLLKDKENEIAEEKEINYGLNSKIKELDNLLKDKENQITELKTDKNDENNTSINKKILDLMMENLQNKEKEIKELKAKFTFEYSKKDLIFTVTFLSLNEDIRYSIICKSTDKFNRLEELFYDKFPEYRNSSCIFLFHDKIINRFNTLENNNIGDNDTIIFKPK